MEEEDMVVECWGSRGGKRTGSEGRGTMVEEVGIVPEGNNV